jgi:GMP synthase (glutamine-hydrolysing)
MPLAIAVRHVAFEDLGLLEPLLADRGYEVRYLDAADATIAPEALRDAELAVVLGGPISANDVDTYPFVADELAAVRARLDAGSPILGICLGAQLIARALGAEVRPASAAEIGYAPVDLTPAGRDSVLAPLAGIPVLHWHGEEVTLPQGAVSLASTAVTEHQAFALGDAVLGLQFHVEADVRRLERWLVGHASELVARGIDPRDLRAAAAEHGPTLAVAARESLTRWLDGLGR